MITRVLLNGINAISAGGKSVIKNIAENIAKNSPDTNFDLVLPKGQGFDNWESTHNMKIHVKKQLKLRIFGRLIDLHYNIPSWCREYDSDICFTLGDVGPIKLNIPHIVLLQQAIILYRDNRYEKLWSLSEKIKFSYLRWHFGKMAHNCDIITLQSPNMALRLEQQYKFPKDRIRIIKNTIPSESINKDGVTSYPPMEKINKPFRLLFLSAGYPHKNFKILPKVALEVKKRKLNDKVHFFLTLNKGMVYTQRVLKTVSDHSDIITNIGEIEKEDIPSAYMAADALFLPTLVESFGLIYLEAMNYKCPIITSDEDFSRWICDDAALYFDPLNPISIVDSIEKLIYQFSISDYIKKAQKRLNQYPKSWEIVAKEYLMILNEYKNTHYLN